MQDGERRYEKLYVPIHQSLCHPVPAARLVSPSVSPWPQLGLMEELARRDPADAEWMHQAAWANQNLVGVLLLTGRADEALPYSARMLELRNAAARKQPSNAHYRHQRGGVVEFLTHDARGGFATQKL